MLRRILLENFMSHARTEIRLAEGLTVLTGPNNCGKSAVVSALQILTSNSPSTHVMRHGEKVCRITVETDDGHTICWERKKATVKYTIDGEDIHRLGRSSVPDALHDFLRLDRVQVTTGKSTHDYDIHFGEQKSPVFLLGETGSRAAAFFASSSDASRLVEMQHRHRSRLSSQRTEAKRLSRDLDSCTSRLKCYEPLDKIAERLEKVDAAGAAIEKCAQQTQRLKNLTDQMSAWSAEVSRLRTQCSTLARLDSGTTTVTDLQLAERETRRLNELISEITDVVRRQSECRACAGALEPLTIPPAQHNVRRPTELILALSRSRKSMNSAQGRHEALKSLCEPPSETDTSRLRRLIEELRDSSQRAADLGASMAILQRLDVPTEESDLKPLRQKINSLVQLQQVASELRRSFDSSVAEAADCEARIRVFASENPRCDTCGSEIDPDTLMASLPGVHAHDAESGRSRPTADRSPNE